MANSDLIATIEAKREIFSAWESFSVKRNYGVGVSIFEFTPCEGSYGSNYNNLKLQPGHPVTIQLAGQSRTPCYGSPPDWAIELISRRLSSCDPVYRHL